MNCRGDILRNLNIINRPRTLFYNKFHQFFSSLNTCAWTSSIAYSKKFLLKLNETKKYEIVFGLFSNSVLIFQKNKVPIKIDFSQNFLFGKNTFLIVIERDSNW